VDDQSRSVEPLTEEAQIGINLEAGGHVPMLIGDHPVDRDNCVSFDAHALGHST
jgi:hypothetical protein